MKPFVPSILRPNIPFAGLTQAYQMREQQLQAQGQPTFTSLLQQAGRRAGIQDQEQPITEPIQAPMLEELKESLSEESKQEIVAILDRPRRNEHYLELPEIDYDEEARLIQEENPEAEPEQIQEVIADLRVEDQQMEQEIDLMNRIADQLQANDPEYRQSQAMQILTGTLSLITFDQGLKLMTTSYDVYKDSKARSNLLNHDQVPENDYSYEEFLEVVKNTPKAAQCKRHVWLSPKSQQLRSILVCSDKYGVRHYQNR